VGGIVNTLCTKQSKKWHFEVSRNLPQEENEFITTLNFADTNEYPIHKLILHPIKMTQENGYILSGNIVGLAVTAQQKKYIILLNRSPEIIISSAEIQRPEGFESALVYGVGFTFTH